MQGLSVKAAVAFAKLNDLPQAVSALEYARAFLLSEALERERTDLARLPELGHADLHQEYQTVLNQIKVLEKPQQVDLERLRQARIKLDNTIEQIREVKGYQDFLRLQPDFEKDIMQSLSQNRTTVLVYTAVTEVGGLALIVPPDGKISAVWLNDLTEKTVHERLNGPADGKQRGGYLGAYNHWLKNRDDQAADEAWKRALEDTIRWLWEVLMGPVTSRIEKIEGQFNSVVLIPQGLLGLLPLHAACTEDQTNPTGRHYALDTMRFTYAPNARALTAAREKGNIPPDTLLAVDNPDGSLHFSKPEVLAAGAHFKEKSILDHKTATRQAVQQKLPTYSVLHFSTHGWAGWNEPLSSGLKLANGTQITLRDIFALRLDKARLAVLSACETGVPSTELPDEVVSLPTGLVQAGVPCVVASLWSVPDISTALLMERFYHNHQKGGMDFVAALHDAQKWVREIQVGEVAKYAKKCIRQVKRKDQPELAKLIRNYQYRAEQNPERAPICASLLLGGVYGEWNVG